MYAASGVLPVPPTVRLPTLIAGMAVGWDGRMPDEYSERRDALTPRNTSSAGVSAARASCQPSPSSFHSECTQCPLGTFGGGDGGVDERLELRRFGLGAS